MSALPSVLAAFMASMVEFVEALTIVLAVGIVRGWRSALLGTGAALALLVALVLALGPTLTRIPLPIVQLVVGTLLLMFGLRWLRKAVLRSAGVLPLHDEEAAFAKETEHLRQQAGLKIKRIDQLAFATAFKIVMLEGIEVVFIVIAIGASSQTIWPASVGALLALAIVILLGFWLHRPLAKMPENALKFGVGLLLSAFGTFWVGEGIHLPWPGGDWSVLVLIGLFFIVAQILVKVCARIHIRSVHPSLNPSNEKRSGPAVKHHPLSTIFIELWSMFVDDAWLAAGIVLWVLLFSWASQEHTRFKPDYFAFIFALGLATVMSLSAIRRATRKS
jgi:uncharacterized membrane protein